MMGHEIEIMSVSIEEIHDLSIFCASLCLIKLREEFYTPQDSRVLKNFIMQKNIYFIKYFVIHLKTKAIQNLIYREILSYLFFENIHICFVKSFNMQSLDLYQYFTPTIISKIPEH